MRRVIVYIAFILISFSLSATNYHVKNGGNDGAAGTSDETAWESISKVNGESFSPGDSIFFNRGDAFIGGLVVPSSGSAGNYIVFGAYGTGNQPIITVNDTVAGLAWIPHTDTIWKTTDITESPWNIFTGSGKRIHKVSDNFIDTNPTDGRYWNYDALELLATHATAEITEGAYTVDFWDISPALMAFDDSGVEDTTYIRFRDGEDPNDSIFYIASSSSQSVYANGKDYVVIQDIHAKGGNRGIWVRSAENAVVQNCRVTNSNKKISVWHISDGVDIRDNYLTNDLLSPYTTYAYLDGDSYETNMGYHLYTFYKYRVTPTTSASTDLGIEMSTTNAVDLLNVDIYNDSIVNCANGITIKGTGNKIYDNYISNTSSAAIFGDYVCDSILLYDNYIRNTALGFRFGSIDDHTSTAYIYGNSIYNPYAGEITFYHLTAPAPVTATYYFYHNSFISVSGVNASAYIDDTDSTDILYVNNIFSIEDQNFTSSGGSGIFSKPDLFDFYYNWNSGEFYGGTPGDTAVWAKDPSNIYDFGNTFWDHSIDPPDFTNITGTDVREAGKDVSETFYLGGEEYSALPGMSPGYFNGTAPDMGVFQTTATVPTVTTSATQGDGTYYITSGGDVTDDGDGTVSSRGICWNTAGNPTLSDNYTVDGSGTGEYTTNLTFPTPGIVYYGKAYATNESGTGLGDEVEYSPQFTSDPIKIGASGFPVKKNGKPIFK